MQLGGENVDWKEILLNLLQTHRARVIGILVGLLVGALFLILGFFKTIFLLLCMLIGYYIGNKIDHKEDLLRLLDKILPRRYY